MSDLLIFPGNALKVVSSGSGDGPLVLEGHLVVFGDETRPDKSAEKDYFTSETDYGALTDAGSFIAPAYYEHGATDTFKNERIGTSELALDDVGVFAQYEIRRRKDYVRRVMDELKAEGLEMGQSSGAIPRDVERVAKGGGVHWLKSWPIWEASLTPVPAEPQTYAFVKSVTTGLFTPRAAKAEGESLSARVERVSRAWYRAQGERGWVAEVFDDAVIADLGGISYRVPYTDDGKAVTFADAPLWERVERTVSYEPIKALNDLFAARRPAADLAGINRLFA